MSSRAITDVLRRRFTPTADDHSLPAVTTSVPVGWAAVRPSREDLDDLDELYQQIEHGADALSARIQAILRATNW
jgi:hypothetical protein